MKIIRLFSILTIAMVMGSCSPIKVAVDQDENTDFSKYKTYSFLGWQNHSDENLSDSDKVLLRDSFTKEFEQRGLQKVTSRGDMEISLYIVLSTETAVSGYNDYVGRHGSYGGYNHYGGGYGYSNNTYKQREKMVGTMIMNIYDKESNKQIWQAVATKTVTENLNKRKRTIPANVRAIMRDLPVKNN